MIRQSMIPEVPEELQPHEALLNIYTTQHYNAINPNKSRPKDLLTTSNPNISLNETFKRPLMTPQLNNSNSFNQGSSFNFSQSNQTNRSVNKSSRQNSVNFNFQQSVQRPPEHLERPYTAYDDFSKQKTPNMNLMNLMREQLEIANKNYTLRMTAEIKKNNDQLMRLEKKVKQVQYELQTKEKEILKLREMYEKAILSKNQQGTSNKISLSKNKQPNEEFMQRHFEYLTTRMRDIQSKIRTLIENQQSKQNEYQKIEQISIRLEQINQNLLKIQKFRFKYIETKFNKFVSIQENLFINFQTQIQQIRLAINNQPTISNPPSNLNVIEQKLMIYRKELDQTLKNVQSFASKEFKYDNFQVDSLKNDLGKLRAKLISFQEEKHIRMTALNQIEVDNKAILQKLAYSNQLIQNRAFQLQVLKKTISQKTIKQEKRSALTINQSKPKIIEKKNNYYQEDVQFQDYKVPAEEQNDEEVEEDVFFYPDKKQSSFQNFTEEQDGSQEQIQQQGSQPEEPREKLILKSKIERLGEIIKDNKKTMPLYCEIDQTGYLKYKDQGTYIFDRDGNLFELSSEELSQVLRLKIIKI